MISTLERIQLKLMSVGNTPYYIADKKWFKQNITDFISAFMSRYQNYNIGYSYKTNYCKEFCDAVKEVGGYAEVVSPKEYDIAISYGVHPSRIIYNGVIPDYNNKLNVALYGGIVNVDNIEELKVFVEHAHKNRLKIEIGVRLNFDIDNGFVSRFGIDVDSDDFEYVKSLAHDECVSLKSIHCHISYARSLEFFQIRAKKMAEYAKMLGIGIVDIGGNMFGRMDERMRIQYDEYIPSYDEYAEIICSVFEAEFPNHDVQLITENGTPIASTAMCLVATIIGKKVVKGKTIIVLDCKRDDVGFSCHTKNPPIDSLANSGDYVEHAAICGCTCIENDIIHRDYTGYANIGDKVIISNIGAYGMNASNEFITDKPSYIVI